MPRPRPWGGPKRVLSRDSFREKPLMSKQDTRATDEDNQDRKEAEQKPKCMRTPHCQQASSAKSTVRAALPPAAPIREDSASPQLKYPLAPTEIHDGRLFRKVG
jgi:hypothetical protein